MKHSGDTFIALRRLALLSLCSLSMAACLEWPEIVQCDGQSGCWAGYECIEGRCIQPDICGNGVRELESGEQCDDGGAVAGDGCGSTCHLEVCGNAILDPGEQCDDGNAVIADGCSDCQPDVTCNDGNQMGGDGCSAKRFVEPGFACTGAPSLCCADPTSSFEPVGTAAIDPSSNEVVLTPATGYRAGAAWFRQPIDLAESLDVRFRVYLGEVDEGADGLAFVFHRDARGLTTLGGGDIHLGTGYIFPSIFVEFDTYNNHYVEDQSDLSCDHAAIFARPGWELESLVLPSRCLPGEVEDNQYHDLRISWRPNAVPLPTLQVFFDGTEIITHAEDLVSNYFGGDSSEIYLGLTASTGGSNNEHKFCLPQPFDPVTDHMGCGNGQIDPGEECDDGNTWPGDGCDAACWVEPACGNSLVEGGEECDDGNRMTGDGCDAGCRVEPACGNGVVEPGEQCDDGNVVPGDGCDARCRFEAECGNGVLEPGEQCDDGNATPGDGCDAYCRFEAECGNGVVEPGEQCDDRNVVPGDGCDAGCGIESVPESEPNEDGTPEVSGWFEGNDFSAMHADYSYEIDTIISATLEPAGDEDVFMVTNNGAEMVRVRFDTHDAAVGLGMSCWQIDTVLVVRNTQGDVLTFNDDRAYDLCSMVEVDIEPGETIYAHVLDYEDDNPISAPGYWLAIDFQ